MKNTTVIHKDWLIPTDEMSDAEYREYLNAIFAYAFEGKRPEDRSLRMLLRLVFLHIDNYEAKYDKSIQQRKEAVRKRWERYRKEHGLDASTGDTTVCDPIRDNTGDTVTVTVTDTVTGTDTGVPVELGTENKEKTPNGVKKKVAAATAAPVAPQQEGKAKRFSRPSVDEVRAYCSERGNAVNAESFVDFYESKGWKVGNSPMKDWRAAVRTWEKRDGRGVIELSPGAITDNIRIKCEYEYRNEAHIDNEIENVFNIVKGQAFRKSYITVSGAAVNATQPEQNAAVPAIETSETNSIASAIDETPYRLIMDNVLNAIASKNYNAAEQYFTPNGADMFRKLINYGKARILDSANLQFSEIDGKTVCRNAAMSFSFRNGMRKSFVEDVVFTFNSDKKIDYIAFGLGDRAQNDILNKGEWSLTARNAIMNFLENYKTAYALKRLDYIEQVFDDNAVIISGCVIRRPKGRELENSEQFISNQYVRYTRVNKDEYIDRLRRSFAGKEFINIRFSNNDVRKMSKGGELYCIQIKQDYYSSNYGDSGYLFLMVDLNRPDAPIIKVRTWQPQPDPDFGLIGPEFF